MPNRYRLDWGARLLMGFDTTSVQQLANAHILLFTLLPVEVC